MSVTCALIAKRKFLEKENIPLEAHHLDGNYSHTTEDNLELICPNCHSLTPTYKAANKGKGRKER